MFNKILITLFIIPSAFASWQGAERAYSQNRGSSKADQVAVELIREGLYFSSIPWMKEALISGRGKLSSQAERALDDLINIVGTSQFELLPNKFLARSNSDSMKYIVAKKLLRKNKTNEAVRFASSINPNHPVYPFALNVLATSYSILGKNKTSVRSFKDCEIASERRLKKNISAVEKRQLRLNKDYCTMGIARANFAGKDYKEADLKYLDIPKSSMIWPEVLFEEAWNSYYLGNYNRTLGKLVTYKAPVFNYIFNPEIEVLNALTFMKLCLYNDAKRISDNFYNQYMQPARQLRSFLLQKKKNYKYFYRMMMDYEQTKRANSKLLMTLLNSISREGSYIEIKNGLILSAKELENINKRRRSTFTNTIKRNLAEAIRTQRNLMGSYVRNRLVGKYAEIYKSFEGMSYIKLEVLAQKKARLYNFSDKGSKRGDIKYIERNDKQYFWDFNGEFWADELGDYVFALGSEC